MIPWTCHIVRQSGYVVEYYDNGFSILDRYESRLDEMLSFRAEERPDELQCVALDQTLEVAASLTFRQAHEWACRVAGLVSRFVPERGLVLLCFENEAAVVAGFFGCVYANTVPVLGVYPSMVGSVDRLFDILEDSGAVAVLGPRETLMGFRRQAAGRARKVKWIPVEGAESAEPLQRRHAADLDDTALVQYTSGSIGRPRGVKVTHRNLGTNLHLLAIRSDFWLSRRGLVWLPLSHDMGLVSLMFGVAMGGTTWLMKPEHFITRPERWVQAMDRYRLNFSIGPNFAYELLARHVPDSALEGLDLSCWTQSVIGAEMIERGTVERFFSRYGPLGVKPSILRPGYGMAETTLMITGDSRDGEGVSFATFSRAGLAEGRVGPPRDEHDERVLADCGRVIEEHAVLVVDPETGDSLPDGRVGELWLSGPCVTPGYLNREQENRERFVTGADGRTWFRSRDSGFLVKGHLFVTGRMENSLPVGDHRYDPDDLAQAVRQACPVFTSRSVAVFRHEGVLCVMGELSLAQARQVAGYERLLADMAQAIGRVCPVRQLRCVLVRQGGVFRTPSGKIRLAATAGAFAAGRLPIVAEQLFGQEALERVEILAWGKTPL